MDITIVCGRRPDLLARTLRSFTDQILQHFPVSTVYANIDPFCGTESDGDACEALLRSTFAQVSIHRPATASFGMAVKRLWQQPKSRYFLHMEDDWEVLNPITPALIEPRFSGEVVQVQMASRDNLHFPKNYAFRTTWRSFLGIKIAKRIHQDRPLFATSPSFILSDFARNCAMAMDPDKDPEKQLYMGHTVLTEYTKSFRNHPLQGPGRKALIRDLGRTWLAEKGMEKRIINGVSSWIKTKSDD